MSVDPVNVKDLEDPQFVAWLKLHPMPIAPDEQDLDRNVNPTTVAEQANEYRMAVARKLIRMYREWKTDQN